MDLKNNELGYNKLDNKENYDDSAIKAQLEYIQNKTTQFYDCVYDMKLDKSLKVGTTVVTLGYYTANDGGGGFYKIRSKNESDIDNGGSLHVLNENVVAELINFKPSKFYINVNQWGILPNGEDVSEKFSNIFNIWIENWTNDLIFYFPSGVYTFKTPIKCSNNSFTIIGDKNLLMPTSEDRKCGTYFKITAIENEVFLDFVDNNCYRNTVKNICFLSDSYKLNEDRSKLLDDRDNVYNEIIEVDNFSCIKLNYNSVVEECFFNGFSGYGIISDAWNYIKSCAFENCKNVLSTGVDSVISDIRFTNVRNGLIINGSANVIDNIRGDSIFNHGVIFDNAKNNCIENYINGLNLDFCYYAGVVLDGTSNIIDTGVIGRVGTSYAGVEYNEDTIELKKCSAIYVNNVLNIPLNYCRISTNINYDYALDGTLNEEQQKLQCPIVKIGIDKGIYSNFEFKLQGQKAFTELSSTNPSRPTTLSEMKRILCINKNASYINYRGSLNYNGINYYFTNLEIDYDPKKIITDTDLPFVENAWNDELSSIVNKSGVINKHTEDNQYYISKFENGVIKWIPLSNA